MLSEVGGRSWSTIGRAVLRHQHYVAAINMARVYKHPLEMYARYLFGAGSYPTDIVVKTPTGNLSLTAYSHHDVLTINEIFCRRDYVSDRSDKIFVDFGANIGISAAYFLSRNQEGFAYLFEPLPQNIPRLKKNLERFAGRYDLVERAVGLINGAVEFGWEPTGRYGGVGKSLEQRITVQCLDSNEVLEAIVQKHSNVDVLKIDVETLEEQLTTRLPSRLARHIRRIYVEFNFGSNPLCDTHVYRQYGSVAQFVRLDEG